MSPRRSTGLGHPRRFGRYLAAIVVALQLVCIGTFLADPASQPLDLEPFELFWAWMHQPSFYPLVVLLIAGPPLTLVALRIHGTHRLPLMLAWLIFGLIIYLWFYERVMLKLEILWKQYG